MLTLFIRLFPANTLSSFYILLSEFQKIRQDAIIISINKTQIYVKLDFRIE